MESSTCQFYFNFTRTSLHFTARVPRRTHAINQSIKRTNQPCGCLQRRKPRRKCCGRTNACSINPFASWIESECTCNRKRRNSSQRLRRWRNKTRWARSRCVVDDDDDVGVRLVVGWDVCGRGIDLKQPTDFFCLCFVIATRRSWRRISCERDTRLRNFIR